MIDALRQWGDKHAAPDGPPLQVLHTSCGHVFEPRQSCSECGAPLDLRHVRAVRGPGAVEDLLRQGMPVDGTVPDPAHRRAGLPR